MRIISGRFRSRQLFTPKDAATTRPIPDRVKESLFGLLRGNCAGANVLDCFAGTGAIGLEAVSLGAARCVFVERDRKIADILERNIDALGCRDECEVVRSDVLGPATLTRAPRPVTLAFFDPPYPLVLDPKGWERVRRQLSRVIDLLSDDGFAVLRTPWPFRHEEVIFDDGRREWRSPLEGLAERKARARGEAPKATGHGKKGRRGEDDRGEREWIGDEIDIEQIQAESEAELEGWEGGENQGVDGDGYTVVRHDVDLAIENAVGPETHLYASQAVHLYMKKRAQGSPETAGSAAGG